MRASWPGAVAQRIGIGGEVAFTTTRIGQTLHLPCAGWGDHKAHIEDVKIAPGQNPEAIAKKLLNSGWKIGHRLVCPEARKKKEKPMPDNDTDTRPAPTPAAGRARRLVYMALEEGYDEIKRTYRSGHSDESIAKDCGVAEALVKTIREESYGPLGTPVEIDEIKADIDRLRREASATDAALKQEINKIANRLAGLVKTNGWSERA